MDQQSSDHAAQIHELTAEIESLHIQHPTQCEIQDQSSKIEHLTRSNKTEWTPYNWNCPMQVKMPKRHVMSTSATLVSSLREEVNDQFATITRLLTKLADTK